MYPFVACWTAASPGAVTPLPVTIPHCCQDIIRRYSLSVTSNKPGGRSGKWRACH